MIVLAGANGAGKSTLYATRVAPNFSGPFINAVTARFLPQSFFLDAGDDVGIGDDVLEKAVPCIR